MNITRINELFAHLEYEVRPIPLPHGLIILADILELNEQVDELVRVANESELLKEFISLIHREIQEDIFNFYPEVADEHEEKARNMWPDIKEMCGIE